MTAQDRAIAQSLTRVRSPLTAIRAFCIQCMGGYVNMIPDCTAPKCPLFAYRMGKNQNAKRRGKCFEITQPSPSSPANSEAAEPSFAIQQAGEGKP